ncbi:MAG: dual specificity protein phosphatase family protein [Phycisphaerales bacterium]
MFNSIKRTVSIILLSSMLLLTGVNATQAKKVSSRPEVWTKQVETKGIGNFHQVSENLYRGKQPTAQGIEQLKQMGVKTIVNLRTEDTDTKLLKGYDFNYVRIPMRAKDPKVEDVITFLKIATDINQGPVFVHCMRGADRTGMMCAAYRVVVQGWDKKDAINEMKNGGYKFSPLCGKLADFINALDVEQIRKEIKLQTAAAVN